MKAKFKIQGNTYQVNFTLMPYTKGAGFTAIPKSSKEIDNLRGNIPSGVNSDDLIGKLIASQIEKQIKLPVSYDQKYSGSGFGIKIDMYDLLKKIK
jgi:hypothetical protein